MQFRKLNLVSYDFARFGIVVLVMRPCDVVLSVVTGVLVRLCPISSKEIINGMADLKLYNNAATSASKAEVITCLIIFESVRTFPLLKFSLFSLERY